MVTALRHNFFEDVRRRLAGELAALGAPQADPRGRDPAWMTAIAYFDLAWRSIAPRPRIVQLSRELQARLNGLPANIRGGIERLLVASHTGSDLNPFLSRQRLERGAYDALRNDWGMHHLHLGELRRGDRVSQGGDEVLVVFPLTDHLLLIDVIVHGEWGNDALFEILHTNWPAIIAAHRFPSELGRAEHRTTPHERVRARKRCVLFTEARDGTLYAPIGGGSSTARTSNVVVSLANGLLNEAREKRDWANENAEEIAAQFRREHGVRPSHLSLELRLLLPAFPLAEQPFTEIAASSPATLVCPTPDDPPAQHAPRLARRRLRAK